MSLDGEEISVDGAGKYRSRVLRTRTDIKEAQIGFNVVRDSARDYGAYRPIHNLPVMFLKGSHVDKEGYVFPQGRILGMYDRQIYDSGAWKYQTDAKKLGVWSSSGITDGKFYGFINKESGGAELVNFNDSQFGYSPDIEGFVGPMNGYKTAAVQDLYGANDYSFGAIDPVTGTEIKSGGATNATLRDAGTATSKFRIAGVAIRDQMRETRNNHYQYQREISAVATSRQGYLTVPFIVGGSGSDVTIDAAAPDVANSVQRSISADQTVLFVEDATDLFGRATINVDAWGNPFLGHSGGVGDAYNVVEFGKLVDFTLAVEMPWAKYVQTYPGIDVAGTGTGGIEQQIFYLARKIKGSSYTVKQLVDFILDSESFGFATIYYDLT